MIWKLDIKTTQICMFYGTTRSMGTPNGTFRTFQNASISNIKNTVLLGKPFSRQNQNAMECLVSADSQNQNAMECDVGYPLIHFFSFYHQYFTRYRNFKMSKYRVFSAFQNVPISNIKNSKNHFSPKPKHYEMSPCIARHCIWRQLSADTVFYHQYFTRYRNFKISIYEKCFLLFLMFEIGTFWKAEKTLYFDILKLRYLVKYWW